MKRGQTRWAYALTLTTGMLLKGQLASATPITYRATGENENHKTEWYTKRIAIKPMELFDPILDSIHNQKIPNKYSYFSRLPQQLCPFNIHQKPILIAVIDTGIDDKHSALRNHLWTNSGETGVDQLGRDRKTNGIDDDSNGYIDDVHGWNFVSDNGDLTDHHGHGTHIAGIILANRESGKLRPSPCPSGIRIMALKYFDPQHPAEFNIRNTIQAIKYATRMGAIIINYSAGGPLPNRLEEKAIRAANKKNILFVAAAGNDNHNVDRIGFFPASYQINNILSVTAVGEDSRFLLGSNFGSQRVHLAAPGQSIYSSLPGNQYGVMSGTSQATAFVTREAAHTLLTNRKIRDPRRIKASLLRRGVRDRRLAGKTRYQVRLRETQVLAATKAKVDTLAFSFSKPGKQKAKITMSSPSPQNSFPSEGGKANKPKQPAF